MTSNHCRKCEHCCKCCINQGYKTECDICDETYDRFLPYVHIKYCPEKGLPLNDVKPVVIMGGSSPTKQEMEQAVANYFKEHKFL